VHPESFYARLWEMKRNDWILIAVLTLIPAILLTGNIIAAQKIASPCLVITVDGSTFGIYDLNEDRIIDINGKNTCTIKDGEASMTYADCPGQNCVHSAAIGKEGGSIVCLPNRVILKIENAAVTAERPDAVTG